MFSITFFYIYGCFFGTFTSVKDLNTSSTTVVLWIMTEKEMLLWFSYVDEPWALCARGLSSKGCHLNALTFLKCEGKTTPFWASLLSHKRGLKLKLSSVLCTVTMNASRLGGHQGAEHTCMHTFKLYRMVFQLSSKVKDLKYFLHHWMSWCPKTSFRTVPDDYRNYFKNVSLRGRSSSLRAVLWQRWDEGQWQWQGESLIEWQQRTVHL